MSAAREAGEVLGEPFDVDAWTDVLFDVLAPRQRGEVEYAKARIFAPPGKHHALAGSSDASEHGFDFAARPRDGTDHRA